MQLSHDYANGGLSRINLCVSGTDGFSARELTGAQATLLMPLWARAMESRQPKPILRDEKSVAIVESLDFDFGQFEKRSVPIADYCIRSRIIDELVLAQLADQSHSTVVELGAGLDTRFDRLDNGFVRWIEFDLPKVIQLRRTFFESTNRRVMVAGSLLEAEWLDSIAKECPSVDLFVAEGVFYFLSNGQVRELVLRLAQAFPKASLIFDTQSPLFLRFSNLRQPISEARLRFSMNRVRELESWAEGLHITRCIGFGDSPFYDGLVHRLCWYKRLLGWAHPLTRRLFQIVQLNLGHETPKVL